tara:strand:+ start:2808 stop:3506 length:699 start_codon:yes stop_codon:yes gene_type:complete
MSDDLKKVLYALARVDEAGLSGEVDILDSYLKKSAKVSMHKNGLLQSTVDSHHELAEVYQKALTSLTKEKKKTLLSSNDKDTPVYSKLREVQRNIANSENAVFLHEMYFEDVYDGRPTPIEKAKFLNGNLNSLYIRSAKDFTKDLTRAAKLSRNGWVLVNYCTKSKMIYIDVIDLHEIGVPIFSIPIAALDMWEHAYFADFGLDKEAYVEWWLSKMDWRNPDKRLKNLVKLK